MSDTKAVLPPILIEEILAGRCVLFLGAGASEEAGAPSSARLAADLAVEFLDGHHRGDSLSSVAAYVESKPGLGRRVVERFVVERLRGLRPADAHLSLPRYPWATIFTTNYDTLIEDAYSASGARPVPILRTSELSMDRGDSPGQAVPRIVKLHGSVSLPYSSEAPLVISDDDYHRRRQSTEALLRTFEHFRFSHTFLFIGYSLGDFDLNRLWTTIQEELGRLAPWSHALWPDHSEEQRNFWQKRTVELHNLTFAQFIDALNAQAPMLRRASEAARATLAEVSAPRSAGSPQALLIEELQKRIRDEQSRAQRALEGVIRVLSTITESRDPYTAGHQRRVTELAVAITEEMGLPTLVESVRTAGLIHDIGKAAVPAEILSKPAALTAIEFSLIQTHPQTAYDALREEEFPWPLAEIILQHHERLDGSGYPRGLSGKAILMEARIIAVADVVEAMASHRPYRAALGIESALAEISTQKGILFDEDVVDACLRLFADKQFSFRHF